MSAYRLDAITLHRDLDQRRQLDGLSWRELGRETGIPASTFNRLGNGGGLDADALLTLLHWLDRGAGLDVFTLPGTGPVDCPGCGLSVQLTRDGAIRQHGCQPGVTR